MMAIYGEINEAVAKNPYDKALFVKNENKISYEDKKYTSRLGVDVSVFQGDIDWEQVKAAGYEFVILRIGYRGYGEEGTLNADEKFEQNMENARKAGIDVGVYFFSQAVNEEEAKEEADFVLEHLKGQELQMPVVYDPEHILEDEARTDGVTGEQFTQNAKVFCKEIEEAGYDAMIYSNMLWEAYELDLEKLLDYPVWYADYEELPQTPYTASTRMITDAVMELYDRIVNPHLMVRRISMTANHVLDEKKAADKTKFRQLDLFTDFTGDNEKKQQDEKVEREKKMQEAVLSIKKKYGKNAILKGLNFQEGATTKERNEQIGGHKA